MLPQSYLEIMNDTFLNTFAMLLALLLNILITQIYVTLSASCSCNARVGGCEQNGLLVPRSPFS